PGTFGEQQVDDLPSRAVAEQLPQRLLMPGDSMSFDQCEKVVRRKAAERGLREMRIGRNEPVGRGVDVGEVAAPAARDQDLLAGLVGVVEQQHAAPARTRLRSAHQPGRSGAEHYRIVSRLHVRRLRRERPADRSAGPLGDSLGKGAYAPSISATSILSPGPMLEVSATFWTYLPLAPAGFALTIASVSALKLVLSWSSVKLILPIPEWMMPCFSTRNSTWPPLASLTACATFGVTVPSFGVGIRPLGPSTLPSRPTTPSMSGAAMTRPSLR